MVPHHYHSLELASDGLGYAAAHGPRLDSPSFARFVDLFCTEGEGWFSSLNALQARIDDLMDDLCGGAPARAWQATPWTWIAQDIGWRLLQVEADCGGSLRDRMDELIRHLARQPDAEGVERALSALDRFCALSREMRVDQFRMVATAAVRDSEDGQTFADLVKDRCGFPVEVLSGREEARLGAIGILGGLPHADGLFGDMGGGSLDLATLNTGQYQDSRTLPLGHLRVTEDAEGDVRKAKLLIDI